VRALLGRGSVYTFGLALQLSSAAVTLPIATRLLDRSEYGTVAVATFVLLILGAIAAAGLPTVIYRTYFAGDDGPRQARLLIALGVAPALLTVAVARASDGVWLPLLGGELDQASVNIALWAVVPSVLVALCQSVLTAQDRATWFVALAVVSGPGGQVAGIAFTAVGGGGPAEYMTGVLGGYLVAAVLGVLIAGPRNSFAAPGKLLARNLRLGYPLIFHGLSWTALALGDRAVIQRMDGADAVGRYHVAYTVGALALSVVSAVANAWTPIVFRAEEGDRESVHRATLAAVAPLAGYLGAALALIGPPVVVLATPASYDAGDLAPVIGLIAASAVPWAVYGSATQLLVWREQTGALAIATMLAAAVNLALVVLLLPPLGLAGAGLATLLAYVLLAAVTWSAARLSLKPSRPPGFAARLIMVMLCAGAALPAEGVPAVFVRMALVAVVVPAVWATVRRVTAQRSEPVLLS
jgi:O-antigen/teichoic acid export membrane protein